MGRLTITIWLLFTCTLSAAANNPSPKARIKQAYMGCDELKQSNSGMTATELQTGVLTFVGKNLSTYDFKFDGEELARKLSDGIFGPTTREAMKQICGRLTQLNVFSPGRSTIQVISNYAWLGNRLTVSSGRAVDIVSHIKKLESPNLAMLAVNKELALEYLQGKDLQRNATQQSKKACDDVYERYSSEPDSQKDKLKLATDIVLKVAGDTSTSATDLSTKLREACVQLDYGQANVLDTLIQVSRLNRHLKGGLVTVATGDFYKWWSIQPDEIAKLLLGGPKAMQALVSRYRPVSVVNVGKCSEVESNALNYYAIDFTTLEELKPPKELSLASLAERTFRTPELLADAIATELRFSKESCEYETIFRIVQRAEKQSLSYSVALDTVPRLPVDSKTKALASTLTALPPLEAPTTQALRQSIIDALAVETEDTIGADITGIADLAAELAEEIPLRNDTSALLPKSNPISLPASVVYVLTEQSIEQLVATIDNPDFRKALLELPHSEEPDRSSINSKIINTLGGVRDSSVTSNSVAANNLVNSAATAHWRPTESLISEIVTHPQIISYQPPDISEIPDEIKDAINGITYPNRRLMEKALLAPAIEPDENLQKLLPEAQRNALLNASLQPVNTFGTRNYSTLAPSCGCALRRDNNGLIYAFHPFWKWPLTEDKEAQLPSLDFAYIDRIAFDGLIMEYKTANDKQEGVFLISNTQHWELAARKFVATAHRYEAKADLAVRIRGWRQWKSEKTADYAAEISSLLNKYSSIRKSLPSSGYSDVPDGITLIFESPESPESTDSTRAATQFLSSLRERLAEHQEITIGFDVDLTSANPVGLLSEFSNSLLTDPETRKTDKTSLLGRILTDLTGSDSGSSEEDLPPAVDRILVFLERPTTDAKKTFRRLIEEMPDFRGSNRRDLFRKIVPIVPPSGNRALGKRGRDNEVRGINSYGQFQDDLAYFRDNFGGIGFWPAPYLAEPDDVYVKGLNGEIRREFNVPLYAAVFNVNLEPLNALLNQWLTPTCVYICPNRNALYAIMFWLSIVIALVLIAGLFVGLMPLVRQAIPYGFVGIVGILTAILLCSKTALVLAPILLAITAAIWKLYNISVQPDSPIP